MLKLYPTIDYCNMCQKICLLAGFVLSLWANAQESQKITYNISPENIKKHVKFLSSKELSGRLTGSIGEHLATEYVAQKFKESGLEPAGDKGTFFQEFTFISGIKLGDKNKLSITTPQGVKKEFVINRDWRPLSFSTNARFKITELVFAGYGISTPTYDSYKGLDVTNKWVMILKDTPEKIARSAEQPYSLRYKSYTAKAHGVKGIIFITKQEGLIPLLSDKVINNSGIVVLTIQNNILTNLLNTRMGSLPQLKPTIFNHLQITGQTELTKKVNQGRNVLAKLKIHAYDAPHLIVVGAHIDHLGRGTLGGSRRRNKELGMIHPGADDNASGVASILETAAHLSVLKAQGKLKGNNDILFAAWSGEEFGILGSSHFVKEFIANSNNKSLRPIIAAAINLDMVGHLRKHLVLQGFASSSDWPELVKQSSTNRTLPILSQKDPYLPTDSTAFYLQGVPTLNLFTGAHDDYHTPRDTVDRLNYKGIQKVSAFLIQLILNMENKSKLISYHEVAKPQEKTEQGLKIYLGTIPDYANAERTGVKLSGVAKDSPAEQAGMREGDIIIQLAQKTIHDIYDYTYVINYLKAGKKTELVILRDQKKIRLIIKARCRSE